MSDKETLLGELDRCVAQMEEDQIAGVAERYLQAGFDPGDGIAEGLAKGMQEAGRRYEASEYYVPELLICSNTLYSGIEVLRPHLPPSRGDCPRVVVGVMEGDCHDIGKNLVKVMLESDGCEVIDLGKDVPPARFVEAIRETGAGFLGLSTLMSTTMDAMAEVIRLLEEAGLRSQVKVMVGGGPVTESFARQIGADIYTANAAEAARQVRALWERGK